MLFMLLNFQSLVWAQSLVEDANVATSSQNGENVFNETIKIISSSKKIFILTNSNQRLNPGDFVSLALNDNLAARALVAKNHQGQVGIKILKIYSLAQWGKLRRDLEVQVIKGDDTAFGKKPVVEAPPQDAISKIKSEEDLYTGDVVVEDELETFDDNKSRHIKPDNVVGVFGSFFDVDEVSSKGGKARATQVGATWAFQFTDNYFAEGVYGRAMFNSYPGDGAQTLVNQIIGRVKYNIKGPLYTFFMPYLGYQTISVSSPDAGDLEGNEGIEEEDAIDKIKKKSGPIFGVTVLRRLVPGWFIKADVGSDLVNVGFAIEF